MTFHLCFSLSNTIPISFTYLCLLYLFMNISPRLPRSKILIDIHYMVGVYLLHLLTLIEPFMFASDK